MSATFDGDPRPETPLHPADDTTRALVTEDQLFTGTLDEALAIYAVLQALGLVDGRGKQWRRAR